jgi:UDP-N-acetylmuramoyl-tripeptide--D-alanyl-D-alanine ligase
VSLGINGSDFKFIIEKEKVIVQNKGNEFNIINNYITGKHNFFNLCAAFSITKVLDPSNSDKYLEAVKTFKPTPNRSQWLKINNNDIFLDAYNANPSSMLLAVEGFMDKVGKESSYCLILGDMNELGKNAESYHTDTARKICELGVKNLIFVGKYSNSYNAGCINKQLVFQNTDELKKCFQNQILNNYKYVFIKGSRSLQLESLLDIK